eukprot:1360202-Rhodomonas_salina.1
MFFILCFYLIETAQQKEASTLCIAQHHDHTHARRKPRQLTSFSHCKFAFKHPPVVPLPVSFSERFSRFYSKKQMSVASCQRLQSTVNCPVTSVPVTVCHCPAAQ